MQLIIIVGLIKSKRVMFQSKKANGQFVKRVSIDKDQLEILLDRHTSKEIAAQYCCSPSTISGLVKTYGLQIKSKRSVNESFFDKWSRKMAYVLGMLTSDGCLSYDEKSQSYSVLFYGEQKHLEDIRSLIRSNHKIIRQKGSNTYRLSVTNKNFYNSLLKLGITPRKSLILQLPNVPDEYFSHFVRGHFDGDGWIFQHPKFKYRRNAGIVSGSKLFLNQLQERLYSFDIYASPKIIEQANRNVFYIYFNGKNALSFLDFIYSDSKPTTRLFRKFDKFQEIRTNEIRN